jgi:hypothetical protein
VLTSLLLVLCLLPATALGAPGTAEIKVGALSPAAPAEGYAAGDEFTVPVEISDNPGFNSAVPVLRFDPDVLECTGISLEGSIVESFSTQVASMNNAPDGEVGYFLMDMAGLLTSTNFTGNGLLFSATFKVKAVSEQTWTYLAPGLREDHALNFVDLAGAAVPVAFTGNPDIVIQAAPPSTPAAKVSVGSPAEDPRPGESFTVPVTIEDNPGFAAAAFTLGFDSAALELKSFDAAGTLLEGALISDVATASAGYAGSGLTKVTGDGTLFKATFTVKDGAQPKDYAISVALKDGSDLNFVDETAAALPVEFAPGSVTVAEAYTGTTIIVGEATGEPGNEVKVPVSIVNNPGFATAAFTITYDSTKLEALRVERGVGSILPEAIYIVPTPLENNTVGIFTSANIPGDGYLFDLVFKVKDSASAGDVAVGLGLLDGKAKNFANFAEESIAVTFVAGELGIEVVLDPTAADLDYDTAAANWTRTYNGSPQTVSVTPKAGIGAVTVKYDGSTAAPTDVGSYAVTVDIAAAPGYRPVTGLELGTLTVNKAAAPTITWPTASAITYGQALSSVALSSTTNDYGSFAFGSSFDPAVTPDAGSYPYPVVFTPNTNTLKNYETIAELTKDVTVTVNKAAAPTITWPNAATSILQGQALSASTLNITGNAYGSFAWTEPTLTPSYPGGDYSVTFTPSAGTAKNYEAITPLTKNVHVNAVVPGDPDGDGDVTAVDALRTLKAAVGLITLTSDQALAADLDADGDITATDAIAVMRKALHLS